MPKVYAQIVLKTWVGGEVKRRSLVRVMNIKKKKKPKRLFLNHSDNQLRINI